MKQIRFKLIKIYPALKAKIGDIVIKIDDLYYENSRTNLYHFHKEIENYPEFWQEITKQPILITEDGKELYEDDEFWSVDKRDWKLRKEKAAEKAGGQYFCDFSTREAAEKWIEENKPKWSDKDLIEFGDHCIKQTGGFTIDVILEGWKQGNDKKEKNSQTGWYCFK